MTLDDFNTLKQKVARIERNKTLAEGQINQLIKEAKEDFGCKSPAEVESRIDELAEQIAAADAKARKLKAAFEEEHAELLSEKK